MNKTFEDMTWGEYSKLFLKCSVAVIVFAVILSKIV